MCTMNTGSRPGVVAALLVTCATAGISGTTDALAGARQSDIFFNCDGSGTAIAKDVGGGVEWSVQNVFFGNRVFGTERSPDGTYVGLTCETGLRTTATTGLTCRSFDPIAGVCGEPVAAEVAADFLQGGFPNPVNSLFDVTNSYVFFLRTEEETLSFSARFLTAGFSAGGQPFLVGVTSPPTASAFLARGIDFPGGTTSRHNFLIGLQTDEHCYDLWVTPTDEHVLVGTFDVAERNAGGASAAATSAAAGGGGLEAVAGGSVCGVKTSEDNPVALIPIAASGSTFCNYEVKSSGNCTSGTLAAGTKVCLPCDGTCSAFPGQIDILFDIDGSSYGRCEDVEVELVTGSTCSTTCSDVKAISAG